MPVYLKSYAVIVNDNILPYDGIVINHDQIYNDHNSSEMLQLLIDKIEWQRDVIYMFGKKFVTNRKTAWYGDNSLEYKYSGVARTAKTWIPELENIKNKVEEITGSKYNSCLLNLYHDGSEGMSWHADDESEIEPHSSIASLSFGIERRFLFRHKIEREKIELSLKSGQLIEMKGQTQIKWVHSLPKMRRIKEPRVNLTFRQMIV